MHRLRHPIRSITEPYGKAGLTVAILALVLATTGAAFAAVGLNSKQKKEVTKIAKKYAGKPGATGPAGPAGTNGTNGTNGTPGAPGSPGANGKTVLHGTTAPSAGTGTEGDFYINTTTQEIYGPKTASWGSGTSLKGTTGFTETLPEGKTLMGNWSLIASVQGAEAHVGTGVSFGIPLETAPTPHYLRTSGLEPILTGGVETEVVQPACPGNFAEPEAEPGNLCVYGAHEENLEKSYFGVVLFPKVCSFATSEGDCVGANPVANKFGFGIGAISHEAGVVNITGTWAVTAG